MAAGRKFLAFVQLLTASSATQGSVWGCGSNVVDRFFRVRQVPKVGEKGFFYSPTKILEASIVGGVTLNHLAWAAELGVPTGLLALQGDDDAGRLIRSAMLRMGVSTECVEVDTTMTTAESYVLSQPHDGERSIIMASGSTSQIDARVISRLFKAASAAAGVPRIITTEISQVPLSGVEALLQAGNTAGALTVRATTNTSREQALFNF
jgi:sugar/nucleoside kinase (ribokinase family)